MLSNEDGPTVAVLAAFADAWNRHDIDAIMALMNTDCVFEASAGPDVCGTRYVGYKDVRAAFIEVWTIFPDAQWRDAQHHVCGNLGLSEWTFCGTRSDGARIEVNGCDLLTFQGNKIALKNSYRKNRPPIVATPRA
jgi:ketosteroid isomerase-like protein